MHQVAQLKYVVGWLVGWLVHVLRRTCVEAMERSDMTTGLSEKCLGNDFEINRLIPETHLPSSNAESSYCLIHLSLAIEML